MITHEYKNRLIQFCIDNLEIKSSELQTEIDEVMKATNEYGPPKDRYDGFKNQQMRKIEMLTAQIHLVHDDIRVFMQIDKLHPSDSVKLGALFTTSDQIIMVACSIGKIEFEGLSLFILSPKVPFYDAVKGAKKGSAVKFRDKVININELT
jgi:hypothetical protein